jgi:hypothetical protein
VALTRGELVERELATGQLKQPFAIRMPAAYASYVVCPQETAALPKIAALREWLLEEAEAGRGAQSHAGSRDSRLDAAMPLHCAAPAAPATRSLRREIAPLTKSVIAHSTLARKTGMGRELVLRQDKPRKRRGRG